VGAHCFSQTCPPKEQKDALAPYWLFDFNVTIIGKFLLPSMLHICTVKGIFPPTKEMKMVASKTLLLPYKKEQTSQATWMGIFRSIKNLRGYRVNPELSNEGRK
jgi:hypothetical protein